MGKGGYETVGSPSDVSFVDPTGQYAAGMDRFSNEANFARQGMQGMAGQAMSFDPNAYMNQFMGQQGGLANIAQGATATLGQSLSAIAERNARLGGEAALAAMPGARHSGAAMAAFGDAYASPFAQAAAQTQQAQLGLTGNLWNQAMGANAQAQQFNPAMAGNLAGMYGGLYGQNLGQYGQMAQGMGSMFTPQYEYRKGFGDRMWDLAGIGIGAGVGRAQQAAGVGGQG